LENHWSVLIDGVKKPVEPIDRLEFQDSHLIEAVNRRCQRMLKSKSKRRTHDFTHALFANDVLKKKEWDLAIRQVDSLVGLGVFARQVIPRLSFVGEYVGVVRKKDALLDRDNSYLFRYLKVSFWTQLVIDARLKGNFTRFINHSDEPNLTSRWVIIDGIYHIILFTNQIIYPGQQLTYDYGDSYWDQRAQPMVL
jgi:SET domain-containing protein